jgi:hypothetical protein
MLLQKIKVGAAVLAVAYCGCEVSFCVIASSGGVEQCTEGNIRTQEGEEA